MPYQPPVLVNTTLFGIDEYADLCKYIEEQVAHLDRRLASFRTDKLPEMVRLYKGKPKNKEVDWPWPGAANLVVQLIGTFSDELLSRVIGGIYLYDPLWTASLQGDTPDKDGDSLKQAVERFMMDEAYDPDSLDLYRVEQAAYHSAIKYGTGGIYLPYEYQKEVEMVYVGGGEGSTLPSGEEKEVIRRDGPHPELLPLHRFGFEPNIAKLTNMDFFYIIESYNYWQFKNLPGKSPYFKKEDIDELKEHPDAIQETEVEREINEQYQIAESGTDTGAARWYIYTCFLKYSKGDGRTYSLIAKYHKRSKKVLYITFNNYPDNIFPVEDMKLAYDDESYLGTGYAEMLHGYQKDLSNNINWRTNNRNYNMMGVWRVSPESKLSSVLDFYPGVAVPAKEGELELLKPGADTGYSNEPDMFIMSASKERAGVDPAIGGTGGGVVNPKRGIYSAAGTSMVLMQQNNRNNLRMGDMRSAHVRLGLKLLKIYSSFGIGRKLERYGSNASNLRKALDAFKNGSLGLQLRPTSSSLNKELDRQNNILLSDRLDRFYQTQAQMLEAMMSPQIPPDLKEYYAQAIVASRLLMQDLLRNFNKENTETLLPQLKLPQPGQQGAGNGAIQQSSGFGQAPQVPRGALPNGGVPSSAGLPI